MLQPVTHLPTSIGDVEATLIRRVVIASQADLQRSHYIPPVSTELLEEPHKLKRFLWC